MSNTSATNMLSELEQLREVARLATAYLRAERTMMADGGSFGLVTEDAKYLDGIRAPLVDAVSTYNTTYQRKGGVDGT